MLRPLVLTGSSPRMRGTRLIYASGSLTVGIIPADAGNTWESGAMLSTCRDHPRGCGEHIVFICKYPLMAGSSPRMRGTLIIDNANNAVIGIIPADAGNTMGPSGTVLLNADHPRGCGEHSLLVLWLACQVGSSPRMRGTPTFSASPGSRTGIIPADAGITSGSRSSHSGSPDHPRGCGEHLAQVPASP